MKYSLDKVKAETPGLVIGSIVVKPGAWVEVSDDEHKAYSKLKVFQHYVEIGGLLVEESETKKKSSGRPSKKDEQIKDDEKDENAGNDADIEVLRAELKSRGINVDEKATAAELQKQLDELNA